MAMLDSSLTVINDGAHSLLEPPSPAYSNTTVRRAFIVWMYCGQANKFKDVCNYYHYLEAMEDKLPSSQRAISRHHEFNMFLTPPPTSPFLETHFPKLYSKEPIDPYYIKKLESIKNEKCIFKLEGFNDIKQTGVTTAEILHTSQIIRRHCKTNRCTLRQFLERFKEYVQRCQLKESIHTISTYIKRLEIAAELKYHGQRPHFSFLDASVEDDIKSDAVTTVSENVIETDNMNSDETAQLKMLLGVPPATSSPKKKSKKNKKNKENVNRSNIEDGKYSSTQEFFKSFEMPSSNSRANSYSPLTPNVEEFVKYYNSQSQHGQRSRSVETLAVTRPAPKVVATISFSSQEFFDASLAKMNELNKFRKI
ncbi:uncharacterized protein LOC114350872 isoform X2 [Ostrinia furnacalis]|nr:uncharacterized protein LOC114350872 isoform X2 [Ostrinia furnacalis]XP_028157626.1 uncharacterized protein LOC114350872 isoform X2 [Ostrinia furnacalis]